MVKKMHSAQVPTPSWVKDGEENETWKSDFEGVASTAQSASKLSQAKPIQKSLSAAPVQPPSAKPMKASPSAEPVKPRPAPADIQLHPKDLGALFAKRPLILGETEANYDELLSQITAAVKPSDAIEVLWIRDVVDLMWESQRLRRLKANLLMNAGKQALANLLLNTKETGQVNGNRVMTIPELVNAYAAGDPAAVVEVDRVLLERGQDADSLMAQALAKRLDDVERLDRMIAGADARRNKALSELERRRDSFARRLRVTAGDITDVVQA